MQIVPCPSFSSPLPTTAPPCSNFYAQKSPHFRSTLQKNYPGDKMRACLCLEISPLQCVSNRYQSANGTTNRRGLYSFRRGANSVEEV